MNGWRGKSDLGYLPVVGESLEQYCDRLVSIIQQVESWGLRHIGWHTHKDSGSCWICESLNINRYIVGILQDISGATRCMCDEVRSGENGQYTLKFKIAKSNKTNRQMSKSKSVD